jgi:hypothetical protein
LNTIRRPTRKSGYEILKIVLILAVLVFTKGIKTSIIKISDDLLASQEGLCSMELVS